MLLKAKCDAVALTFAHRSACDLLRKDYLLRVCGCVRLRAKSHIAGWHNVTYLRGARSPKAGLKSAALFFFGHLVMIETQTDPKPTAWV